MSEARLGSTLRGIRRERNWTLSQVSERTRVPISTLSKIEKGQLSPTYDQLVRLSAGLSVDMAELFSAAKGQPRAGGTARRSINHLGGGESVETPHHVLRYLSTDLIDKQFSPILAEVTVRRIEDFGDFLRHPGQEFLFVLEGKVEFHTEFYAPVLLSAGESIYFDSDMGHAYLAHGEGRCLMLSVCTAPILHKALARQVRPSTGNGEAVRSERKHHGRPALVNKEQPAKPARSKRASAKRRAS